MSTNSNSGESLDYSELIQLQGRLMSGQITRMDLAAFVASSSGSRIKGQVSVRVWRNYAVEPMEIWFQAVGQYWGHQYKLIFTGYDDSFSFGDFYSDDDLVAEVLMVDRSHYVLSDDDFLAWLSEREQCLSSLTKADCFTVVVDNEISIRFGGVTLETLVSHSLNGFFDSRYERATGSRLKPETHSLVARELSSSWLPSRFTAPKKLVVVDLDFTLHGGILGEGMDGLFLDEHYIELQRELLSAKNRGFMLAILSKNDRSDVLNLLQSHSQYVLSASDFVAIEANWGPKTEGMTRILERTRIHQDAVVFIDDNPVELLQMKSAFPDVSVVSAADGPALAVQSLRYVPAYRRSESDALADIRIADLMSNEERDALIVSGLEMYYRTASPVLKVSLCAEVDLERLIDLGKRTNQFNVLMTRSDRNAYVANGTVFVSLALTDRFSDSGIIGGILVRRLVADAGCEVTDLFLSCRVLGRGLETALICRGLLETMNHLAAEHIRVSWIVAERNEPALKWLGGSLLANVPSVDGSVEVPRNIIEELAKPPEGVTCEIA